MLPLLRIPKTSRRCTRVNPQEAERPRQRRHRRALALAAIAAILLALWRQVAE